MEGNSGRRMMKERERKKITYIIMIQEFQMAQLRVNTTETVAKQIKHYLCQCIYYTLCSNWPYSFSEEKDIPCSGFCERNIRAMQKAS